MRLLIDTDWMIHRLSEAPCAVELIRRIAPQGVGISVITYLETYEGIARSSDRLADEQRLEQLIRDVPILPLSEAIARRCAELRAQMRTRGRRVNQRALDLIITATAIEHDLTLVTRNVRDFADIPGLQIRSG
jgi:predicted nucleic acid-binding protein